MSSLVERENFGWLPDPPDIRDKLFLTKLTAPMRMGRVNLRDNADFPVYDQGDIGSCVGNAVAYCIEYAMRRRPNDPAVADFIEKDRVFTPSRLFIYYGAREIIGLTKEDSGCHIRDACKVVYNLGAPRETGWKYNPYRFAQQPPPHSYRSAPFHKITSYRAVKINIDDVRLAIAEGFPVVGGIAVYRSFFNDAMGNIPMPDWRTERLLGWHAVVFNSFDDATARLGFRNSWGQWAIDGHGTLPYDYINDGLAGDFWLITDELYKERLNG